MLYLSIRVFCKVSSGPNFNKMIQQSKAKHPSSNDLQTNNIVTIMDATPKKKGSCSVLVYINVQFEVGQIKLWSIMYLLVTGSFRWVRVSVNVQYIKLPEVCIVPEILGQLLVYCMAVSEAWISQAGRVPLCMLWVNNHWTKFPWKRQLCKVRCCTNVFWTRQAPISYTRRWRLQNKTKQNQTNKQRFIPIL